MALNEIATFLVIVGTLLHIWVSRMEARRDDRADKIAEKDNLDVTDATDKAKRNEQIVRYAMATALILALFTISASILSGSANTRPNSVANNQTAVVLSMVNLNWTVNVEISE